MMKSESKEVFAEWLAVPKELREPRTQKELAAMLDEQPWTLSRWKKEEAFQTMVFEKARTYLGGKLPQIMHVIAEKAVAGQFRFVKLALELTNMYEDKITVETEKPKIGIEQYSEIIRQIDEWREERLNCQTEKNRLA